MKVFLNYSDNSNENLHKTLKMTLPKSWKEAPTSRLLGQFVESYNVTMGDDANLMKPNEMHLAIRNDRDVLALVPLPSDALIGKVIVDHADVYVLHGKSQTMEEICVEQEQEEKKRKQELSQIGRCTHFGCKNTFPKGGPYPECVYHVAPPVFHETAKFWSCCPNRKAYDWNDFEAIEGCHRGVCTEIKPQGVKSFLGGTDLRAQMAASRPSLRSIDDFNRSQAAGAAAPLLDRLRHAMSDMGIEQELYDQVVHGIKKELREEKEYEDDASLLEDVADKLGRQLKQAMKNIAIDQLRIKNGQPVLTPESTLATDPAPMNDSVDKVPPDTMDGVEIDATPDDATIDTSIHSRRNGSTNDSDKAMMNGHDHF
eukprot:CAMPEP_0116846106 /NCGR_PEP_ID=MMETSP0418-20121206/13650_1 /TAXON_ID=1158023 /ORGANISM="Astrosyne radiata, Strain 13vi08-1A" /LENGTH=369 /DNA_ID=CAMNT_0004477315 /DNA_START=72 /DNA_END=1181 /DNA_ORIENTATION=+